MKYWHKLLKDWRAKGNNGFTIPFIIGSQQYLPGLREKQDVKELIYDIFYNEEEVDIYITYCQDLNDLILGIRDETKLRIAGEFIKLPNNSKSNLFLTKIVNNLGNNVDGIARTLEEKYQMAIDKNEFSVNNRVSDDFTNKERDFIIQSFSDINKCRL